MDRELLTTYQAAQWLKVGVADILNARKRGALTPVPKAANQVSERFQREDLSRWAERRKFRSTRDYEWLAAEREELQRERGRLREESGRLREEPRPQMNQARWIAGEAIYVLFEYPYSGEIAYVGRSNNPGARLTGHKSDYARKKGDWLRGVLGKGGAVACAIIEWVTHEDVARAEAYWIHEMLRRGHKLTNSHIPDCQTFQGYQCKYTPSVSFDDAPLEPVAIVQ